MKEVNNLLKGWNLAKEQGREEREKEILEIIDKWDDGEDRDVEELKQKIKENLQ